MVATHPARPLTIEDLDSFPDDGMRREIMSGELIVSPAPSPGHQILAAELFLLIAIFVREHGLGRVLFSPVDVRLSESDVVEPDIVFIPTERKNLLRGKFIDGRPELVVEVLSSSTRGSDLIRKRALYASAGIPEYWIADPDAKSLTVLCLEAGVYVPSVSERDRPVSKVLPGITIDTDALFSAVASDQ